MGGNGYMEIFDDSINAYALIGQAQIMSDDYNFYNGECWPAIKGVKTVPWWMKLLESWLEQTK